MTEQSKKGEALRERAHSVIPGGAHAYAKGDDQFPTAAPAFVTRGEGCHVWDLDGNEFIEYGMEPVYRKFNAPHRSLQIGRAEN